MQQAELIDSAEKLKELESAANDGFARAQFNLAVCYEQGKWVEQDMEKAIEWYKKSAEQGNANAMCNLATMYQNGFGRKKHVDEMLNLFTFDDRPVGQPNYQMALHWYQKAVEHGSESAKQKLATLQSQMKQHN